LDAQETELPHQLGFFNEAEAISDEPEVIEVGPHKRGKRKEFYEGLETRQVVHELPEEACICPDCGGALHACGHEVLRREVEVIPARVSAVEHVQTVYTCRGCEKKADDTPAPMVKSSVPAPVIANSGIASPSLLSFIISNKYVLALPLYRQEQELKRIGIHIYRQTMANWVIFAAMKYLEPVYKLLHTELTQNFILHADETSLQVVRENGRKASQKSYMWMYHTGRDAHKQVALFEYQQTREGKHPRNFLEGFSGFLHVDAYAGYRELEDRGITLVECWAHARRKFDEALKSLRKDDRKNALANIGLQYCDKLFALERKFDELNLNHEERAKLRKLQSKPVAEAFFAWAREARENALPKNKLGVALAYAVNQQPWLMNFLLDGRLELSNNRAERSIRPFTVGRKNWLFSFSEKGAKASAIVYSIIETAQANGLVPFLYLNYLFETLPNLPPERFAECLPWVENVQKICAITNLSTTI
jgi:transposase